MTTVTTRVLKDQLSSYLRRAEQGERIVVLRGTRPVANLVPADQPVGDEKATLAALAARGLVDPPAANADSCFDGPLVSVRGKSAAEMVIEDRR